MLNREPMGMKLRKLLLVAVSLIVGVSVLNREPMGMKQNDPPRCQDESLVSVLNREPMGMKRRIR